MGSGSTDYENVEKQSLDSSAENINQKFKFLILSKFFYIVNLNIFSIKFLL